MSHLIVVENHKTFPFAVPGAEVVTAREYLTDRRFVDRKRAKVFNLCRNNGYQSLGYYVSLLAAARNHKPLPSLATIQDLRQMAVVRIVKTDLDELVQKSLKDIKSDEFELSIYFGRNLADRHQKLCQAVFEHFPAPLLRANFRRNGSWKLVEVSAIAAADVPEAHREFLIERVKKYFSAPRGGGKKEPRYDLAILVNPEEADAPSNVRAIAKFSRAAREVGIRPFVVEKSEYAHIAEYDALFIRETTSVNHHTYRFARRAAKEGLVVIDDPESILRCCNKVYQAEIFEKYSIPCPRTMIVHAGNRNEVGPTLGYPCVLKRPDSSFSQGVVKAENPEELEMFLSRFLQSSALVVAQAFAHSDYDWRIGVLGGEPLFACRYYMARGHWQIQKTSDGGQRSFGKHETLPVETVPSRVIDLALKAAGLMGTGLYGVDIKECGPNLMVMEVNDNPNIEAGVEDAILKQDLYLRIMKHFFDQLEKKGRGP